ncbi:hypothetical protein [Oceanospirillum beijerinckii]|uniref:hypothetical protein n=1 Tax=Oceanospirillum beijerinckii TaxID=64976 RepID=UPI0004087CC8|nr:hypothetical protein [Oceanospirillum beijerinckii]MAC47329.1 hypothetical protein [Oceanospirillum sp.]
MKKQSLSQVIALAGTIALAGQASITNADEFNPNIGLVLDGIYKAGDTALQGSEKGFGLGHTEITMDAPVDDLFYGRLTAVLEDHDGSTEVSLEEAFVETTSLPYGLQAKAGRFLSNVGYLNGRHTHEDNFAERPAVYRALLGSHYYDDGLQLTMLMPTDFYWQLSAEGFNGRQLSGESHDKTLGVYTLGTKFGGDLGDSNSWQIGASYLHNRLTNVGAEEDDAYDDHDHSGDDHSGHSHSAQYVGKHLYIADAVWKWAPSGNAKSQQLMLSGEWLYAEEPNQHATSEDFQRGWYLAASYRFTPQWTVSARTGQVELSEAHGDHFHGQEMKESNLALSWRHSHFSLIRAMYTHQDSDHFDEADDTLTLQYQMILGAHGAHQF